MAATAPNPFSQLPSVNVLADAIEPQGSPREVVVETVRHILDTERALIRDGHEPRSLGALAEQVQFKLQAPIRPFKRVINATGVVLHTNLGRAPLPSAAREAMLAACDYSNLEYDLKTGQRASRLRDVSTALADVTGADAGLMVNNNAAATLLTVSALAEQRPTAISRGQLVEIGGSFRLPDIIQASTSPLMEIGTTNRTHLVDYEKAIQQGAGLLLVVHRSNFSQQGYVTEPALEDIIALGRNYRVPVVYDLGSGCLRDLDAAPETTVSAAVRMGFDAICFSGDKMMGGPQGGYVVGNRDAIDTIRNHPLARAVRCDKIQLAAGLATLALYASARTRDIPALRMFEEQPDQLRTRAQAWCDRLGTGEVISTQDAVGGGSMPNHELPGAAWALTTVRPHDVVAALRETSVPIIARIHQDKVLLHPRTVLPEQEEALLAGVAHVLECEVR